MTTTEEPYTTLLGLSFRVVRTLQDGMAAAEIGGEIVWVGRWEGARRVIAEHGAAVTLLIPETLYVDLARVQHARSVR